MAIVGSAKVRISPDTTGFAASLRAALEGSRAAAAAAGRSAGEAFDREFSRAVNNSMRNVARDMRSVGTDIGRSIGGSMQVEIQQMADQAFSNVTRDANRQGSQAGESHGSGFRAGFGRGMRGWNPFKDVDRDASSAGDRTARSFTERFNTVLNSGVGQAALAAGRGFTVFFAQAQAGAVALSGLVGTISALVSGLYLLGTAAASAGASLAALGGLAGAAIQGGIALMTAFKGVGKAISSGMKEASGATSSAGNAAVAAARRVADARARLQEVQIANSRRVADAENKIKDARQRLNEITIRGEERVADAKNKVIAAEQRYVDATNKVAAAQAKYNDAIREGQEYLQQLAFDSEDAVLAQERAAIELEKAQARAQQARDVAPEGSRARQEIELALKEAELAMRRANDRVNDLAEEQAKAAEAGLEGTKAVTDATNDIIDATNAQIDAENDLAQARADAAKAAIEAERDVAKAREDVAQAQADKERVQADNARDLAKARLDLARAIEDQSKADIKAASAANSFDAALKKLSPSAQEFVKYLVGMRDRFNEFKKAVQEPFFAAFNKPFFEMVRVLLPAAETGLAKTSGILGTMAGQFAGALTANLDNFTRLLEFNNKILGIFAKESANGESAVSKLVDLFFRFGQAIEPITERFTNFITGLIDTAHAATNTEEGMSRLTAFFDRAGDRMAAFGSIFGHIIDLFGTLATAAAPAIDRLLQYFDNAFANMAKTAEDNLGGLGTYFDNVAANLEPLLDLLGQVGLILLEMGASPKLGEAFEILKGAIDPIKAMISEGNDVMPVLAEIIVNITRVLAALSNTGAIEVFFGVFKQVSDRIATLFEGETFQAIAKAAGPILGLTSAFSLLLIGVQSVGNIILGKFLGPMKLVMGALTPIMNILGGGGGMAGIMTRLGGSVGMLASRFSFLLGPVGAVIGIVSVLVPMLIKLYNENEGVRTALDKLFAAVGKVAGALMDALGPVIEMLSGAFSTLLDAIMPIVAELVTALVPVIETIVNLVGEVLIPIFGDIIRVVVPIIMQFVKVWTSAVVPVIKTVVEIIKVLADVLSTVLTAAFGAVKAIWDRVGKPVFNTIGDVISGIVKIAEGIVSGVQTAFTNAWNAVTTAYNNTLAPIIRTITGAITGIPGAVNSIIEGIGGVFRSVGTTISGIWERNIHPIINTITGAFENIPDAISGAFNGLRNALKTPLNVAIDLINSAIGAINTVTSPFGIPKLGTIPKLATGGYITGPGGPTDDKVPAWLSSGEYVVKASTVKAFGGKAGMDLLNAGKMPVGMGGWNPVEAIKDGAAAVAGLAGKALTDGIRTVVKPLWDSTLGKYGSHLRGQGDFVGSLLGGFIAKLEDKFFDKVSTADKEREQAQASAGSGASLGAYNGPPGGWTFPLGRHVGWRTYPGHRNAGAIDFPIGAGTPIRAVTAGVITLKGWAGPYGNAVYMAHNGYRTRYAHMSRFGSFARGANVPTGAVIGYVGTTGNSTGNHLHFEISPNSGAPGGAAAVLRSKGVKLATGGVVKATPGGIMAMLAEGGKHERVEPLDSKGLSARDYAMIEAVAKRMGGGTGNGVTLVRVYIGEKELTDIVKYEVNGSQTTLARNLSTGRRAY